MTEYKQLWDACLGDIELNVSKANFSTWFKDTSIIKYEFGTIYVGVPNEFVKDWLLNKFNKLILKTLVDHSPEIRAVEYTITKHSQKKEGTDTDIAKTFINKELPLSDLYINKEDNLNPRYVFESFIVGPFNELAHAAAQSIIRNPGRSYNPLYIYGDTGLGKTHLIQAIGNAIKQKFPEKKVNYITLEKFATDLINSFQNNKAAQFKEKYRKYDVLIIDDIQFVGKMEKTQEELFHMFNFMFENNKQIVFSSDKHPNFIPGLEDRLRSRFNQGMIIDVLQPEYESRMAILKAKIAQIGDIPITDEIIEYLATTIQGNVRELEGNLNVVICHIQLKNRPLSLNEVKGLIKNSIKPKKNISIKEVAKVISDYYNLEESLIYEKTRRKEIVRARQLIMYILREDFNVSYPLIGQKLGGKDHTTVIHSCEKVKNDLKNNVGLSQEIEELRLLFK